jgi:hypothetical protein
MILEQGRHRLRISDSYVLDRIRSSKSDVIEFVAMARESGRGSVELDSRLWSIAPQREVRAMALRFSCFADLNLCVMNMR